MQETCQRRKIGWYCLGLLLCINLVCKVAAAHEIHLKNGKVIRSKYVEEKDGMVRYETKDGTVSISSDQVQMIVYSGPAPTTEAPLDHSGAFADYRFNKNANDAIDPRNNGVVHGAKPTADRFNTPNSAYRFDGKNSYIEFPAPMLTEPPFSVSLWFNTLGYSPQGQFLLHNGGDREASGGIYCQLIGQRETYHGQSLWPTSGLQCGVQNANADFRAILTLESIPLERWNHVVYGWDGTPDITHVAVYLNGKRVPVLQETGPVDITEGPGRMKIGIADPAASRGAFEGKIDDVQFYHRLLSAKEIQQLSVNNPPPASPVEIEPESDFE